MFLSGCGTKITGPTDKTEGEAVTPTEIEVHKGFIGLDMEFVKGQPPSSLWENTDFPITLRTQNKGAYDIQGGLLAITGNLYFVTIKELQFDLEGKSQFNPEGEFGFEKFPSTTIEVDENIKDSFSIIACYQYKTYGSSTLCINPRILDTGSEIEGECTVGSVTVSSGQGAPVAITKIEEEIIPAGKDSLRLELKIHVSNKGGGKVVSDEFFAKDCTGQALLPEEVGEITIDDIRFSNYRLDSGKYSINCNNIKDSRFRLSPEGSFIIECYADLYPEVIGSTSFTTPLIVELSYGYSQLSESKTITVKNTVE